MVNTKKKLEEMQHFIEVMQAYLKGEQIETRVKYCPESEWKLLQTEPVWDWVTNEYRVKPKPSYVQFKTAEQCFAEAAKHNFAIRSTCKEENTISMIVGFVGNGVTALEGYITYPRLVENYVWADDKTPCGLKNCPEVMNKELMK